MFDYILSDTGSFNQGETIKSKKNHVGPEWNMSMLVICALQANHVSDGMCDLIQNLFAYYILAYITL